MDFRNDGPIEGEYRVKSTDESGTAWRNSADWAKNGGPPGGWQKKAVNWTAVFQIVFTMVALHWLAGILKIWIH